MAAKGKGEAFTVDKMSQSLLPDQGCSETYLVDLQVQGEVTVQSQSLLPDQGLSEPAVRG